MLKTFIKNELISYLINKRKKELKTKHKYNFKNLIVYFYQKESH